MAEKNYITPSGLAVLKAEYHHLVHTERPKLVEIVAWAASNGDRSENADYIYGKRRLREIDSRLRFLTGRIERAEVVQPAQIKSDKVSFGATVTLEDEDGLKEIYQLVGEDETKPDQGMISWKSPIGSALMGKRVDDDIVVRRPAGEKNYVILQIEYR